jgi:hypothetical protein
LGGEAWLADEVSSPAHTRQVCLADELGFLFHMLLQSHGECCQVRTRPPRLPPSPCRLSRSWPSIQARGERRTHTHTPRL